jgi:hypothetical protein
MERTSSKKIGTAIHSQMELKRAEKLEGKSLVGYYFIKVKWEKDCWVCYAAGKIVAMLKDNYWYLVEVSNKGRSLVYSLPQMNDWFLYLSYSDYKKELDTFD